MLFEEYLSKNIIEEWKEYYIDYKLLKNKIESISEQKINSEKEFNVSLENEWNKYINFYNYYLIELHDKKIEKKLIENIINLNFFAYTNQTSLRKIIKKHDKNSKNSIYPAWEHKIKYKTYKQMFNLLKKISKLYEKKNEEHIIKMIDQSNFVRKSIKFWIPVDKVVNVISNIIEHLPIYTFNDNNNILGKIDSIYLDNTDFTCYNTRIKKEEGSKLIRLRWYDDNFTNIFVERKVHHENWTSAESSKNRFQIKENQIIDFFRGQLKLGTPLSEEIQSIILKKKLFPIVRTSYKRIAFQKNNCNQIRISLDTDLSMIKEKVSHLEWYSTYESLKNEDIFRFPFAVLEIKLQNQYIENPPEWIQKLMESSMLIKMPKFSKFIHSTWQFNPQLNEPYWIDIYPELFKKEQNIIYKNNFNNSNFLKKKNINHIKIEPKTYFANERTYLQWFNAATFVVSAGIAILEMSSKAMRIGIIMITFGFLMALYAVLIYYYRLWGLYHRKSQIYYDPIGPILMTIGLILAAIVNFTY